MSTSANYASQIRFEYTLLTDDELLAEIDSLSGRTDDFGQAMLRVAMDELETRTA